MDPHAEPSICETASKSIDGTVRLLATVADEEKAIKIWQLDPALLPG